MNEILPGSALHLGFKRFTTRPELTALVECLWSIGGIDAPAQCFNEKVYPDGGCSLSIEIDANYARAALTCNKYTSRQQFSSHGLTISARLRPGAIYALFKISPADLPAHHTDASLLLTGSAKSSLQQLLLKLPQCPRAIALKLFEQWLLQQCLKQNEHCSLPARLSEMLQQLSVQPTTAANAAATLGMSRRTLERQMALHTGFNPAYFKQCQQIKLARQLLCQGTSPLADIALCSGFYDQAHFSHTFSSFVGETPAQYQSRKLSQIYNTAMP